MDNLRFRHEEMDRDRWEEVFRVRQNDKDVASQHYQQRGHTGASGIVVLITSQHPLVAHPTTGHRNYPGAEYRARLLAGLSLTRKWQQAHRPLQVITLGDVHRDEQGIADECSLAHAGASYLLAEGLDPALLLNDQDARGWAPDGVYCTEDEVAVAAEVFKADPRMCMIVAVCGQAQAMRVMLAGQNNQTPLQVHTPLVTSEGSWVDGVLTDPAAFHHDPACETVDIAPLDVVYPVNPQPFTRVRNAVKATRVP